ncbi:MAG: SDR family oxidoreductase [Acidimicrobiales bacterium]|nr:SDR family oxidoreductase [Acidimicrobiales bacterium]
MTESRVALVTGGARGIGAAVVRRLHAQGRCVAIADLLADEGAELAEELDGRAYRCDVTDSDGVRDMVAAVESDLGPIDVLVNCAGFDRFVRFVDTDEDFWDTIIDINYKGTLRTCHAVLPGMTERGWGRIVNFASDAARVGSSLESVYAGAKAGVIGFTKTIARETVKKGVTCNVVCPGPTDTTLIREMGEQGDLPAKIVGGLDRAIPIGRMAQPDEIAYGAAVFTHDDANFITGQTLSVSGGLTMA